jgi:hypothetical protein
MYLVGVWYSDTHGGSGYLWRDTWRELHPVQLDVNED